jgi:hypothetical protein
MTELWPMKRHIEDLVQEYDIEWKVGCAYAESVAGYDSVTYRRYIYTPIVCNQVSYMLALHEIAHCIHPQQNRELILDWEARCWLWALEISVCPPKASTYSTIAAYLDGHSRDAQTVTAPFKRKLPPLGSMYWQLRSRLNGHCV